MARIFIALTFDDEVIKECARIQEILGSWKFNGKLIELENLHLTLKFLGEIDENKLSEVKEALKTIKENSFECKLDHSGLFSVHGNPKITWLKLNGKGIFDLQKKIDEVLESSFKKEERFMSHLTIARIKYVNDKAGFRKYVENIGVKEVSFKIKSFQLIKSELKPSGPVYNIVEEYSLLE
ncbi:MAG: RNA 2',3'-cyclic phosphodiesterase [Nanoarchaeota archaeon]